MSEIRVVPTAALGMTTIALVLFVTLNPTAAMWACVVALLLAVCGLFTLAKETIDLRVQLDDADRATETLRDALMAADQENAILAARLEDVHPVPHLRVVRAPSDSWLEQVIDEQESQWFGPDGEVR